jgi:hypothetical protein
MEGARSYERNPEFAPKKPTFFSPLLSDLPLTPHPSRRFGPPTLQSAQHPTFGSLRFIECLETNTGTIILDGIIELPSLAHRNGAAPNS